MFNLETTIINLYNTLQEETNSSNHLSKFKTKTLPQVNSYRKEV